MSEPQPQKRGRGRPPTFDGQSVYHVDLKLTKENDQALDDLHRMDGLSRSTHTNLAIQNWRVVRQRVAEEAKQGNFVQPFITYQNLDVWKLILEMSAETRRSPDQLIE